MGEGIWKGPFRGAAGGCDLGEIICGELEGTILEGCWGLLGDGDNWKRPFREGPSGGGAVVETIMAWELGGC